MEKVKDILHIHKSDKSGHHGIRGDHGTHATSTERVTPGSTGSHSATTGAMGKNVPGGVAAPGGAGTGANVASQGEYGHGAGKTMGVGSGSDYPSAEEAARQADDEAYITQTGAVGKPVGAPGGTTSTTTDSKSRNATTDSSSTKNVGGGIGSDYGITKEGAREVARPEDDVAVHTRAGRPAGSVTSGTRGEGDVIDRKYYTDTEARPQDQAVIEKYREHNPYEKEYETSVRHTGRERQIGSQIEALGTEERVLGQDNLTATPHAYIDRTVPTGAMNERPGGEGWVENKAGPAFGNNTFTVPGDRTVDKERVTNLRDHRDFEKEFEVATRLKGEHPSATTGQAELLDRDHVLLDDRKRNTYEGHPTV